MTIYYVDSAITDTNVASATPDFTTYNPATFSTSTGSDSVFKTIADLNAKTFSAGDSILFRKGQTWREQHTVPSSGSSGNQITYGAFGSGANPVITGSNLAVSWTADGQANTWNSTVTTQPLILSVDGVLGFPRASKAALVANNEWFWVSNVLSIYSTTDPNSKAVESGNRLSAFTASGKNYITITGFTIRGTNGRSILGSTCTGWTVTANTVELTGAGSDSGTISFGLGGGHTVSNNIIRETWNDGIYFYESDGNTISGNTITRSDGTSADNIQVSGPNNIISGNSCDQSTTQNTTKGNIIMMKVTVDGGGVIEYNSCVGGLYPITTDQSNLIVRYNKSSGHTVGSAYGFAISNEGNNPNNQQWYYNISNGDRVGFYLPAGPFTNILFYGNTVYNSVIAGFEFDGASGTFSGTLKNNIFYGTMPLVFDIANPGTVVSDNNIIGPNKSNGIYYNGTYYATLAAYKSATGKDTNSINSDPLFTNAGAGDFTLQPGSPAIDVGANLGSTYQTALLMGSTWPSAVLTGNQDSYGAGWEIGAYIKTGALGRWIITSGSAALEESGGIFASGIEDETDAFTTDFTGKNATGSNTVLTSAVVFNHGAKGGAATFDGTVVAANTYKTIADQTEVYIRIFFKLDSAFTFATNAQFNNILFLRDETNNQRAIYVRVTRSDPNITLKSFVRGATDSQLGATQTISLNTWYRLEVRWKFGSGTTGIGTWWLDGTEIGTKTNCDFTGKAQLINRFYIGGFSSGLGEASAAAGSIIYFDDVKASTTAVGDYAP